LNSKPEVWLCNTHHTMIGFSSAVLLLSDRHRAEREKKRAGRRERKKNTGKVKCWAAFNQTWAAGK